MTRDELEHAIRAACDVADDTEVWVFGSQSILGQYQNPPEALTQSMEVDMIPRNHPERWEAVDGALGEESSFHQTFHFWIQGIETTTADLAPGWEGRCIQVQNANTNQMTGWCLEGHDLALAKLSAWRDKDKEFVTILLAEGLAEGQRLLELLEDLPVDEAKRELIRTWIAVTMDDLAS